MNIRTKTILHIALIWMAAMFASSAIAGEGTVPLRMTTEITIIKKVEAKVERVSPREFCEKLVVDKAFKLTAKGLSTKRVAKRLKIKW